MKKRILATALVACAFTAQAQVKTGPEIETLYPVGFHHDQGDGLYIEFQSGAMPGCYGDKGGGSVKVILIIKSITHCY